MQVAYEKLQLLGCLGPWGGQVGWVGVLAFRLFGLAPQ